jgi:crotonobetainyl-CoA:carnitine CoA-transferase CaiB-like acyl-CoA transferase
MTALEGMTILDLTRVLSGPYCTMLLADLGARVIKVEQPGTGDDTRAWGPPFLAGESAYFLSTNRNKESIAIDFKQPAGLALIEQLVARADVLVENFRPGTLEKARLDYASLAPRFPRLVYCSISGFGQTGPRRAQPGYDAVMQAEGGLMSFTGMPDGPPIRLGVAITDMLAGLFAAQGITAALFARERTGVDQLVDIAMLDAVAAVLSYQAHGYFATGVAPQRIGNRHPSIVPYETFPARDGEFVLAVGNDAQWRRCCDVVGLPHEERFATNRDRVARHGELKPLLDERLRTETRAHWIERLTAAGVPCGAVRDMREVFEDPQLAAREMAVEIDHATIGPLRVLGTPFKLSNTPASVRTAPPTLGQHTEAVLMHDLGLSAGHVAALRGKGVI